MHYQRVASQGQVSTWFDEYGDEDRFEKYIRFGRRCSRQWSTDSIDFPLQRLQDREVKYLDEGDPPNH